MVNINDKDWYFYLNDSPGRSSVTKVYGIDEVNKKWIISYEKIEGDKKTRLFTLFDTPQELEEYITDTQKNKRFFYEVIKNREQKPHFDIDVDLNLYKNIDPDDLIKNILESILTVTKEYDIILDPIRDILIYSSNGPKKLSYHIIIDNYYHINHKEAGAFYLKVRSKVRKIYIDLIDSKVYSSLQQFRLLGSTKASTNRYKIFVQRGEYIPKNELTSSLISYTVGGKELPHFLDIEDEDDDDESKLTLMDGDDLISEAMDMLATTFGDSHPFEYKENRDNFMLLKRLYPSYCDLCNRIHENENPYMFITKGGILKFNCRRAEGIYKSLGRIIDIKSDENKISIETAKKVLQTIGLVQSTEDMMNILDGTIVKEDIKLEVNNLYKDSSTPLSKESPTPLSKDSSTPLSKDSSTPLSKDSPTPLSKDSPTPLSKDSSIPLSKDSSTTLSKDSSTPLSKESTPLSKDSSTPLSKDSPNVNELNNKSLSLEKDKMCINEEKDINNTIISVSNILEETRSKTRFKTVDIELPISKNESYISSTSREVIYKTLTTKNNGTTNTTNTHEIKTIIYDSIKLNAKNSNMRSSISSNARESIRNSLSNYK